VSARYNKVAVSTDGVNWSVYANLPASDWSFVRFGCGVFAAVPTTGSDAAYSVDGVNWTKTRLPGSHPLATMTFGGDRFIAVPDTRDSVVFYSLNGINWLSYTILPVENRAIVSIAYGQGRYVAGMGNASSNKHLLYSDGF
ncbi:MAG: hypothetical protein LUE17_16415, partial [Planctomycetaceae bacterium]|nr:hypothetical protein [Planctomycetaceae bacterium]